MYQKKIRGESLKKSLDDKYHLKKVTFEHLIELFDDKVIVIPEFQRLVDHTKVDNLKEKFKTDHNYFLFCTAPLQLCKLTTININCYFLIDGQHRFFAIKDLYEELKENNHIQINIFNSDSIDEIYEIYLKFNIDNPNIFSKNDLIKYENKMKYIGLRDIFNTKYKKNFKNNDDHIYSIEEYIKILENENYLDYFDSIEEGEKYILNNNDNFYDKYYKKNEDIKIYYKIEQDLIKEKKVFTLRNNNFLEYLMTDDKNDFNFEHSSKKNFKKMKIVN
jgi:hypothetical protein